MPKTIAETLKEMQSGNLNTDSAEFADLIEEVNEAADTSSAKEFPFKKKKSKGDEEDEIDESEDEIEDEEDDEEDDEDLEEAKDVFDASGKGNFDTTGKGNDGEADTEDDVPQKKGLKNPLKKKAKKSGKHDSNEKGLPSVGNTNQSKAVAEQLNQLFNGENLSEAFTSKAILIFEASVNDRVASIEKDLTESYQSLLENAIEDITEDMSERISKYMSYVCETWAKDNVIAIENGIKNQISENFIKDLKTLLENNYIDVPDTKFDILEDTQKQMAVLEKTLSEQIDRNIEMQNNLNSSSEDLVFQKVAEGLTDTEIERFETLVECVDFDDAESYASKITTIKKSFFSDSSVSLNEETNEINNDFVDKKPAVSGAMGMYSQALDRMNK